MTGKNTAVLLAAAGSGSRMGGGIPKQYRLLGDAPVLVKAARAFCAMDAFSVVTAAVPAEDMDYCVLTHMDIDHAGGIGLVQSAKHIMASEAEWAAACGAHPRYLKRLWRGISIETFPDRDVDLFGDGTVTLLPLHGHSAGMTGVKVGGARYLIIAGDAGYGRPSWERLVLPGICWNRAEALASLRTLQAYGNDENCVAVLMTHDTEQKPTIFEL